MGSPSFFKVILTLAVLAGLAYGAKTYWTTHEAEIRDTGPKPVIHQPPAVPNPYGK